MRIIYLSKSSWRDWIKVWSRNSCFSWRMSANSPPGKSDGENHHDIVVPPIQNDNTGPRFRDLDVDSIRRFLAQKLGFYEPPDLSPPVEKVLDEVTLDGIAKWIKSDRCQNIITLSGAGISTSAGIPDFRSPETGIYHNLQKYDLPEPQAIFEINFFKQNPKPFFTLAKELFPGKFKPTVSHYFIKLLHEKGLLLRHYTQNIDTLERGAGIPEDKLVEAHGTFYTSHCLECRKEYPLDYIKSVIFADQIPICTECPGVVKPDIVFFGESLPDRFQRCLAEDFQKCHMLIIMGSSLEVQPFASLIDMVPEWCPRLLINREKAGVRSPLLRLWGMMSEGLQLDGDSIRDVARLGDCDDGCLELADKLGWGDELRELVAREHARIDSIHSLTPPLSPSTSHELHDIPLHTSEPKL
ncbi:NAD-dependent protein deacetylase sirtuin-2-like [Melitaea cinxia]|uniref:NAD-dependent protein deacetylase sirtuin-2-like n=1 Tax=Melitaea cinxia TaxID=113334 RepID=UPI001E26F8E5|nr:NAD-dependent protein deacetylase sirtuin-2-like [Melitaea cinxia]XP_045452907.1 NAD-dependent protein deacetylase sirtuin-2-like [Melitaea cinxia]